MRALVTGGAGFIGSSIARALVGRGDAVRILDNFLTGFKENIPGEAETVEGDVRDLEAVREACAGVDVVFHQAALRSVPQSVDDPRATNHTNVDGTLNVLTAAAEAGVGRVVYASSSSVYGDVEGLSREDMPIDPQSPYAVSKLTGELYCRVWTSTQDLSTVSLRYFNVFGPGQHPESQYAAIFPGLISRLVAGRRPEVDWDGEQSRDFVFIDDVVRANLAAAAAPRGASGRVFNIGTGATRTVNQVVETISQVLGTSLEPIARPKRAGDVRTSRADVRRAREELGWSPEAEWDEAVAATVRWFAQGSAGS
ncbi:MAG TPA: SDR family oxidoreductase [Actinomycetota bacterium]|nr:SDR family oxidoreductase [Actinomycetota bacterium]